MQESFLTSESFDLRETYPSCIESVASGKNCTASYAIAAAHITSEKYCIGTDGQTTAKLSPQDILSCDAGSHGCQGGELDTVWNYIRDTGLVDTECFPLAEEGREDVKCEEKCENGDVYKI
jgi:hypothetical protein